MRGLLKRIGWSVVGGIAVALLFSAWATAYYVLRPTATADHLRVGLAELILVYLLAGVIGGVMFGMAVPLHRWRAGSALLGFLTALPLYLGASLVVIPQPEWIRAMITGVLLAALIGAPVGYLAWNDQR